MGWEWRAGVGLREQRTGKTLKGLEAMETLEREGAALIILYTKLD